MRILRPFALIVLLAVAAWPQLLAGGIDDIAIDTQDNILVAVADSYQVLKVTPDGDVSVFAGTGEQRDVQDPGGDGGSAVSAELRDPTSVTVDPQTNEVYIADHIRVRKVDINGNISTVVGNGNWGDGVARGELAGEFALGHLLRIEFDPGLGKLYILQWNGRVWRVENGRIYHHAGSGEDGCGGDGGSAVEAQFNYPSDLAVGPDGSLYLSDQRNYRIRTIDPNGLTITAITGNGRYAYGLLPTGTPALRTGIRDVYGLAFDPHDLIHFVDDNARVYRLERNETLTPFSEGLGSGPGRMVFNPDGNLIIAEARGSRILEVSSDVSQVRTIADLESSSASARASGAGAKTELLEPRHIIGGREVTPGDWPFVVRVDDSSGLCTASLVAPNWVLTAAHCLVDDDGSVIDPSDLSVFLGYDWDKGVCENTRGEIGRVIIHPDYYYAGAGFRNDAALVEILQPAAADPIKLLTPEEESQYAPSGTTATSIGWGRQQNGSYPRVLRAVDIPLMTPGDCLEKSSWTTSEIVHERTLCAGVGGKGVWSGDSGGPLVVSLPDGGWGQVGVTSMGGGARAGYPAVFTRTSAIRDWVYEQTGGDPYALPSAIEGVGGIVSGLLTKEGVKNAASFAPGAAPEAIVSLFGRQLARNTSAAHGRPLPLRQAGVRIEIIDSSETAYPAQLFYAGREQVNFLMPAEAATGEALLRLTREGEEPAELELTIGAVAPGLFSANGTGEGIGAITAHRVGADGARSKPAVFRHDAATGRMIGVPLELGDEDDQVFLTLFGTGIRGAGGAEKVQATIGGRRVPVMFAGEQAGRLGGLDRVEIGPLPRSLEGAGEVNVTVTAAGITSNPVTIVIE